MSLELKRDTSANGWCWLRQITGQVDNYKKQQSSEQSHPTVFTSITIHLFLLTGVHIPPPKKKRATSKF